MTLSEAADAKKAPRRLHWEDTRSFMHTEQQIITLIIQMRRRSESNSQHFNPFAILCFGLQCLGWHQSCSRESDGRVAFPKYLDSEGSLTIRWF